MTHDPLCYVTGEYYEGETCDYCELIDEVRADERNKVANEVAVMPDFISTLDYVNEIRKGCDQK